MSGWYLSRAHLAQANLNGADLRKVNLSNANLHGARLICSDLREANLMYTNLTDADLRGALTEGSRGLPVVLPDRKSVVSGKSVTVRVDLGGRRIIKNNKCNTYG